MGEDWLDLITVADVSLDRIDDLDSVLNNGEGRVVSVVTESVLLSI